MRIPVYLDHHATTPCDPQVVEAMAPYWGGDGFGNANARHNRHGRIAVQAVAEARHKIASLINGNPGHLHFTAGASEANRVALQSILPTGGRDEIIVGALEHPSITDQIPSLTARGFGVKIAPATPGGMIAPAAVAGLAGEKTAMIIVMLANHELGTIQPVADIAAIARQCGARAHCDATQAVGKIPVDVQKLGVHSMAFSAHKIYGPQGIGALYMDAEIARPGTVPLALAVGFGAACDIAARRMAEDAARMDELGRVFLQKLQSFRLNGDAVPRLTGSFNVCFPGVNAEDVLLDLADSLSLSTGAACASGRGEPSSVLRAIGMNDRDIAASIRISFGRGTTVDDVLFAAEKLNQSCALAHAS